MRSLNHIHLPMSVRAIMFSVMYFGATAWAYSLLGH